MSGMNECDCYIVKRNGDPLTTADYDKDSPNAPSRIELCKLHAAAPELLEAAADALALLVNGEAGSELRGADVIENLRKVVAKIGGEV